MNYLRMSKQQKPLHTDTSHLTTYMLNDCFNLRLVLQHRESPSQSLSHFSVLRSHYTKSWQSHGLHSSITSVVSRDIY